MGLYELKDAITYERSYWDSKAGFGREFQISALDQNKSYSVRKVVIREIIQYFSTYPYSHETSLRQKEIL